MEWIKVEDRLPNKNVRILCYCEEYSKECIVLGIRDEYTSDRGVSVIFQLDDPRVSLIGVTHWMPLPEPPKEYKL